MQVLTVQQHKEKTANYRVQTPIGEGGADEGARLSPLSFSFSIYVEVHDDRGYAASGNGDNKSRAFGRQADRPPAADVTFKIAMERFPRR